MKSELRLLDKTQQGMNSREKKINTSLISSSITKLKRTK